MWEQRDFLASAGELVPLSTQIISPTLADAFMIPPHALENPAASEQGTARAQSQFHTQTSSREPLGFVRYDPVGFDDIVRPFHQPSVSFHPESSGLRSHPNGSMRTGFAERPTPHHAQGQPPQNVRDSAGFSGQPTGGFSGVTSGQQPSRQDGLVGSKRTSQHTEPHGSASAAVGSLDTGEDKLTRALKRPRLVWTSQLHTCFVDAVNQLGLKNAVPKTIMQLMGVEGLTRENVASHLQKYRLQLRKEGKDTEGDGLEDADHQNAVHLLADAIAARRPSSDSGGANPDRAGASLDEDQDTADDDARSQSPRQADDVNADAEGDNAAAGAQPVSQRRLNGENGRPVPPGSAAPPQRMGGGSDVRPDRSEAGRKQGHGAVPQDWTYAQQPRIVLRREVQERE